MIFLKQKKAQGALEYLLLVGGAIVIAAIVLYVITTTGGKGANTANAGANAAGTQLTDIASLGPGVPQLISATTSGITFKPTDKWASPVYQYTKDEGKTKSEATNVIVVVAAEQSTGSITASAGDKIRIRGCKDNAFAECTQWSNAVFAE